MKTFKTIANLTLGEERALYNVTDCEILNCVFAGPEDGESALKECRNIAVRGCKFSLRYPLWHAERYSVEDCTMDQGVRAAVWYSSDGVFKNCTLEGIKIFRECRSTRVINCNISSDEAGWRCRGIDIDGCKIRSLYLLLGSRDVSLKNTSLDGKYSLQYAESVVMENCEIDTKDCLWHAKNVTAKNCVFRGEYLAWYSENFTLVDCTICGTQPLCYCKNLKLINCRMVDCDRAFELSDVDADIKGRITSVRSPLSGRVVCDGVGEIIRDVTGYDCRGEVVIRNK